MKILSIATTYPRWKNDTEPSFVHNLNRELTRQGHGVIALVPHASKASRAHILDGVHIKRFIYFLPFFLQQLCYNGGILPNIKSRFIAKINVPFFLIFQAIAIWRETQKNSYDIVHCHWIIPQGLFAAIICRICGIPLVLTAHGSDVYTNHPLFTIFNRLTFRIAKRCVVNSRETAQRVRNMAPSIEIDRIAMGVDIEIFHPSCSSDISRRHMGNGTPQIVFVGRLSPTKGLMVLLKAFHRILQDKSSARLAIIGTGSEQKILQETVTQLGISKEVRFLGAQAPDTLPAFMASADMLILSSIGIEGFGVVLIEAMACGTPVIGSNTGGIPDIIDDTVNGLLVPENDSDALSAAIAMLIHDTSLRDTIIQNGRTKAVKEYAWPITAKKHSELYSRILFHSQRQLEP